MEIWRGMHDSSWDEAQDDLLALGLTDGLPVVPPTRRRVHNMLESAGVDGNAVLGTVPPAFAAATWEDVAINAVLAGCEPAYLPVVGAAVAAMTDPAFNLLGIATTTGSAATLVIVNGPVVRAVGMNSEANALGPGNRANATIGRAVRLVLQNVGGAQSGTTDMATVGQPAKYTFCFAENEAATPWAPLHVERGFATDTSVVTVIGTSGSVEIVDTVSASAVDLARTYAQSMLIAGNVSGAGELGGGEPLIVLPPEHADVFRHEGYSKDQVKAAIFEQGALPLDRLSNAVRDHLTSHAGARPLSRELRVARSANDIMVVVAGGVGRKGCYIPTWSGGTKAVSRAMVALK